MNRLQALQLSFAGAIMVFFFQNCSKPLEVAPDKDAALFQAASGCMGSSADACLFNKSAVAQVGKTVTLERIGGYQSYGVSIEDRDNSGFLQNADFMVTTSSTDRVAASQGFRHYFDPNNSRVEQVMAYYSANLLRKWFLARGGLPSANQTFKIIADSSFNAWVPAQKELHLERGSRTFPAALDGTVIVQLYAEANIWAASSGASHSNLSTKHVSCTGATGLSEANACCSSNLGCGAALVNGSADYMVAAVYGDGLIGQGWKNSTAGLQICGLSRTPASSLTLSTASAKCTSRGAANNAVALGVWYASVWWKAREQATDKNSFDRFFVRHLSLIDGADDFTSIKTKIQTLDTNEFGGAYSSLLAL